MLRFHPVYFILTLLFLSIEVFIAVFVNDNIIRPYLGDMLVVILMYCFIRALIEISIIPAILLVLVLAMIVETLQYLDLLQLLGLENSVPAKIILGNTFSWEDIIMYLLGGFLIWATEKLLRK